MLGSFNSSIGRKKTSFARVLLKSGTGSFFINGIFYYVYFKHCDSLDTLNSFLSLFDFNNFDIFVTLFGGGFKSQIIALRLALCRSLCSYDFRYKIIFKKLSFLNYDSRIVERKKVGFIKSRKRKQYSKR